LCNTIERGVKGKKKYKEDQKKPERNNSARGGGKVFLPSEGRRTTVRNADQGGRWIQFPPTTPFSEKVD